MKTAGFPSSRCIGPTSVYGPVRMKTRGELEFCEVRVFH